MGIKECIKPVYQRDEPTSTRKGISKRRRDPNQSIMKAAQAGCAGQGCE